MKLFALFAIAAALFAPKEAGSIAPVFHGSVSRIDAGTRARMVGSSWHPGCPVRIRNLRLLKLDYWGYDGSVHRGRMVVNARQAAHVVTVFRKLFYAHFQIRRMRLIDVYGADDDRSLAANNTAAFNCRFVAGTSRWSMHAYGLAVDINPVQNPYVNGSHASPPAGRAYLDRTRHATGMIHAGDVVVRAFASVDWEWGGYWSWPTDYQHFSSNGR
ncbi:MAG TPA: M15 family metallopeptidase [Gaiellaceae bacterium]|nr:M15 family metallopeptidase [Gaiellaceae bacterium]